MLEALDLPSIQDERARQCLILLLTLVEDLTQENQTLREDLQRLHDAINRLKGEQGKPTTTPATTPDIPTPTEHSSERERHKPHAWAKGHKLDQIMLDREQVLTVDRAMLPPDAACKGYEPVVVQEISIQTDNVRLLQEQFSSATAGKTSLAELPLGYDGAVGPGIRARVILFACACPMTEPNIRAWLQHVGGQIAAGQIANRLINDHAPFHAAKAAAYAAGLRRSPWQPLDDTGPRVHGQHHHGHVVDHPLHTPYVTTASKDRLTVIDVWHHGRPRRFRLQAEALGYRETAGVSGSTRQPWLQLPHHPDLDAVTMQRRLEEPLPGLGAPPRQWIVDAAAVAASHAQTAWPVVRLLLCDGALQCPWVTEERALGWRHAGRHEKQRLPYVPQPRTLLDDCLDDCWTFYDDLLVYRQRPTATARTGLWAAFDTLCAPVTGSQALEERMAMTRAKKASLRLVLDPPAIPRHNHPAEWGARQRVRQRAISFGPRTAAGAPAWDTFMSLAAPTKTLGVNFSQYIHDRISGANQLPSLASIIDERAKELHLGASWADP